MNYKLLLSITLLFLISSCNKKWDTITTVLKPVTNEKIDRNKLAEIQEQLKLRFRASKYKNTTVDISENNTEIIVKTILNQAVL